MDYLKYIVTIGVLIAVSVAYEKFKDHTEQDEQIRNYEIVKRYLVSDSSLAKSKLPILWIHNEYNVNARNWPSFFSRNTIRYDLFLLECFNQIFSYKSCSPSNIYTRRVHLA